MALGNSKTLTKVNELPKFNRKRIESIYAVYENSRYGEINGVRTYHADIVYYNCYIHSWDGGGILKVKELPQEFQQFFGLVENRGRHKFITNMSFRLVGSGHASHDDTLSLGGWETNATDGYFYVYRGFDWVAKDTGSHVILNECELAQAIFGVMGKNFEVKKVKFWECEFKAKEGSLDFATKYPYKYTPIQIIDGMVYKDEKLPSWRWLHGMPFRVPEMALDELGYVIDFSSIRVWDDFLKCHVYLQRVDKVEAGDEDLLYVDFPCKSNEIHGSDSQAYCKIRRMAKSIGGNYCKHTIEKVDDEWWSVKYYEVRNGVKFESERTFQGMFYRIIRILSSQEQKFVEYKN